MPFINFRQLLSKHLIFNCMETESEKPRLRPVERHCPRCNELLVINEQEECIECLNCGYIDCGDED